jgi:hypothetical protein
MGVDFSANQRRVSVGLRTRTRIGVSTDWRRKPPNAGIPWRGPLLVAPWRVHRTWPLWPGGVRYVQSESLKVTRLFLAGS